MAIKIQGVTLGNIGGGPSSLTLEDLADVSVVSPQTGQYLRYNASITEWQNASIDADTYSYLSSNMTGSNGITLTYLSGPKTIDIAMSLSASGDATGTASGGVLPLTLATVNSNVGTYGSSTAVPQITVDAKGRITGVTSIAFGGTAPLATSLAGGSNGALVYQSSPNNTSFIAAGTTSQVLIGGSSSPSWSSTPSLTGTNFSSIPNSALTNDSVTVGSTSIALGATSTTLAGLTNVTSTAFTGNASSSTYASGTTVTDDNATSSAVYPLWATGSTTSTTSLPLKVSKTNLSYIPSTGVLSALGFEGSGANLTDIPNSALTYSGITIGSTSISLGGVTSVLAGLSSVTSTSFVGALSGNASTATKLSTARNISATGDATWTVSFDGSADETSGITLATVNLSPVSASFQKITTNGKGLVTATTSVSSSDITTALGYTPVNTAGSTMSGNLVMGGFTVTGLASPVNPSDAATKLYVDAAVQSVNIHAACEVATASPLTATYDNGTAGVGATLTATTNVVLPNIDGYTGLAVATSRILVKNQADNKQNGIYVVTSLGSAGTSPWVLTRTNDYNNSIPGEVSAGDLVFVAEGNTLASTSWVQTSVGTGTGDATVIGTDPITFTQFAGAGSYTAGAGLTLTGTVFSLTDPVTTALGGTGLSSIGSSDQILGVNSSATGLEYKSISTTGGITVTNTPGTVTIGASSIPNSSLANSSVTINGTTISLGASGTVDAAAGTLTGTTLASNVVGSSLTSVGTLSSLTVSGTTTTGPIAISTVGLVDSAVLVTSTTSANQIVDSRAIASYRAVKYVISVTSGSEYQYTEVQLMQDGTTAYINEINTMLTGASLASFDADVNSGSLRLLVTPVNAVTTIKTIVTAIAV